MNGRASAAFVGIGLALAATSAWAQVDCSRVPEGLQPRCELVNRMREHCASVPEKDRGTCERDNLKLPTHFECAQVPAPAQRTCEQHNRAIDKIERCRKLTGSDQEACLRSNASRRGYRQL